MEKVLQSNSVTKVIYQGGNQLALQFAKEYNRYTSDEWVTFVQAKVRNLKIKEGEHGVKLVKYVEESRKKDGKIQVAVKTFTVFNLDQTEPVTQND